MVIGRKHATPLVGLALATSVALAQTHAAFALAPVDSNAMKSAWALYTKGQYAASADAFEALIRKSTPNATLYYYAACANKNANRIARARQLCQYVTANFSASTEAAYASKLFPDTAAAPAAAAAAPAGVPAGLPDSMKNKSLEELMQSEEGRKALKEALAKQKSAGALGAAPASGTAHASSSSGSDFSASAIATDGANGVTQCYQGAWFESGITALAMIPRGQALIASMIRKSGDGSYNVRFPGDGQDIMITPHMLESAKMKDKALWATLLHCALVEKLHGRGSASMEDCLAVLTGKRAEKLYANNTTQGSLVKFISDAVRSGSPIIAASGDDFGTLDDLVESDECYTITGFDAATEMITLRTPHGENSRRFRLKDDPDHKKFEQLNDGVCKMNVSLFPHYFTQVCSASI
ncbi:MAG TPA: hypothetical protein V6C81_10590 [Planktothrix sp.]